MNNRRKIEGVKELEVSYIHGHPECPDKKFTFEPVEADSIKFETSWLEFKYADTDAVVHIPIQNIFEVWVSDFCQQEKK